MRTKQRVKTADDISHCFDIKRCILMIQKADINVTYINVRVAETRDG